MHHGPKGRLLPHCRCMSWPDARRARAAPRPATCAQRSPPQYRPFGHPIAASSLEHGDCAPGKSRAVRACGTSTVDGLDSFCHPRGYVSTRKASRRQRAASQDAPQRRRCLFLRPKLGAPAKVAPWRAVACLSPGTLRASPTIRIDPAAYHRILPPARRAHVRKKPSGGPCSSA
ncbi:hypothetical protein BD626DRAFT_91176 [Schizophyllum amplum]|uniref:Uncharacterized protein n=1 Tax=Schizophyllum amplum TaxID=97359 RepID=A0A550C8R5_9AGAR|nr:hypothetical protein BD626DRAFT_91176 [Auriculariopsis ampla]